MLYFNLVSVARKEQYNVKDNFCVGIKRYEFFLQQSFLFYRELNTFLQRKNVVKIGVIHK